MALDGMPSFAGSSSVSLEGGSPFQTPRLPRQTERAISPLAPRESAKAVKRPGRSWGDR